MNQMKCLILLVFLFITSSFITLAQTSKPASAEGLYQQALELYAEDNFKESVTRLERAEKLSPKVNAKIVYLKTKALYQLCQMDKGYVSLFEKAFNTFMEIAPKQSFSTIKIQEITNLQPQLQLIVAAKQKENQRLLAQRDSLKADSTRKVTVTIIYAQALQLYEKNSFVESYKLLTSIDTLVREPDAQILYLKIKTLYPLFTTSATYKADIKSAFSQFTNRVRIQNFPTDKKQEIADLETNYLEKIKQIEAENAKKNELARLYKKAEQLYEEDKLIDCIAQLEQLENFMGKPDAKVLYLKIKALQPLIRQGETYKIAFEKSLPVFFETAKIQNYTPLKIQEISSIQQQVITSIKAEEANSQNNKVEIANLVEQSMVLIDGGSYKMGSKGYFPSDNEKPLHKVTVSNFYLGKHEVTQYLWQKIMDTNPSTTKDCADCPVDMVSWNETQEFIKKLNEITGKTYRLPTEAEWEYVRKGGQKSNGTTYAGSDKIEETSWTLPNSGGHTHPVGQKAPNELGIYDMIGNVMEWVQDGYSASYYKISPELNPVNLTDTGSRVIRGFSYKDKVYEKVKFSDMGTVLINLRVGVTPSVPQEATGFRLVRSE